MRDTRSVHHAGIIRLARAARIGLRRLTQRVSLSRLFLAVAIVVVATAMLGLGNWIGAYLGQSISRGVAATAASSIDALIANSIEGIGPDRPVAREDADRLDAVFLVANEADSTRLLQIRIRDLDGRLIYQSFGGIVAEDNPKDFAAAASGNVISRVSDLPLQAAGPFDARPLAVLEIHTPLRRRSNEEVFAVAELYYSAKSILELQRDAQIAVWLLVGGTGFGVIAALYLFVAQASRTVASHRANLARNLEASRRLAEENLALHAASEKLRVDAALSNEALLANVGSDLHDGPIQLMTLIILRLSKAAREAKGDPALARELQQSVQLATDAMEELRNISAGLVLPELSDLSLGEAVALAVTRHEAATGELVRRNLDNLAIDAPMTIKICAYRVVQEALNNAFWHGDKSAPTVAGRLDGGALRLRVTNKASAAKPAHERTEGNAGDAASLGLKSMRFRVEALGGRLSFGIISDKDAAIEAVIPFAASAGHAAPAGGGAAAEISGG
jgi:signal transduction histidine kinase